MKKFMSICFLMLFVGIQMQAQESATEQTAEQPAPKYWSCNGIITLNANATGLWNWAAGGNNNITTVAAANVTLLYKKDVIAWETNLDTDFGMSYLGNDYEPWRKSNDKINFTTKFGWEFHKTWYLTALGSFKSQYANGFEYDETNKTMTNISSFLSPSYTDISVGIDWKPNDIFSVYISPVAGRISTCLDTNNRARYGIALEKNSLAELGLSAKAGVNYTKIKNLKIISTVGIFTPYSWDKDLNVPRRFGNFDVDWDSSISYQFLKVLNVTLTTSLKYYPGVMIADKNGIMAERVQFKGNIGLGIGYSF